MRTTKIRRLAILITAASLALGLGATGIAAAFGGRSSERAARPPAPAPTSSISTVDPAAVRPSPRDPSVARTVRPTPDPNALADGTYPTYIRAVDVHGATITVDVLQTFFGAAARQAAIEDGVRWRDVRYAPVYIRNENPLLRTLRVARDTRIKLIGQCTAPSRSIGLRELREATTPFTDTFYYDLSVSGGRVERVRQVVAVSAC